MEACASKGFGGKSFAMLPTGLDVETLPKNVFTMKGSFFLGVTIYIYISIYLFQGSLPNPFTFKRMEASLYVGSNCNRTWLSQSL